jgi:hypothetical protein
MRCGGPHRARRVRAPAHGRRCTGSVKGGRVRQ